MKIKALLLALLSGCIVSVSARNSSLRLVLVPKKDTKQILRRIKQKITGLYLLQAVQAFCWVTRMEMQILETV